MVETTVITNDTKFTPILLQRCSLAADPNWEKSDSHRMLGSRATKILENIHGRSSCRPDREKIFLVTRLELLVRPNHLAMPTCRLNCYFVLRTLLTWKIGVKTKNLHKSYVIKNKSKIKKEYVVIMS